MEKLDNVVKQIQVNILLEYKQALPDPNVEKITNYIHVLEIINKEFDERFSTDVYLYKNLAKETRFVGRLPLRG